MTHKILLTTYNNFLISTNSSWLFLKKKNMVTNSEFPICRVLICIFFYLSYSTFKLFLISTTCSSISPKKFGPTISLSTGLSQHIGTLIFLPYKTRLQMSSSLKMFDTHCYMKLYQMQIHFLFLWFTHHIHHQHILNHLINRLSLSI